MPPRETTRHRLKPLTHSSLESGTIRGSISSLTKAPRPLLSRSGMPISVSPGTPDSFWACRAAIISSRVIRLVTIFSLSVGDAGAVLCALDHEDFGHFVRTKVGYISVVSMHVLGVSLGRFAVANHKSKGSCLKLHRVHALSLCFSCGMTLVFNLSEWHQFCTVVTGQGVFRGAGVRIDACVVDPHHWLVAIQPASVRDLD